MLNISQQRKFHIYLSVFIMVFYFAPETCNAKQGKKSSAKSKHSLLTQLTIGLGAVATPSKLYQVDIQGNTNKADYIPFINSSINYKLGKYINIAPELGIYIPESSVDKRISKLRYYILAPFEFYYKRFLLRLGTGLSFTRISSDGGTQILNNGNSSDQFPMPEVSSTSSNIIINLGAGFRIHKHFSLRLESFLFNIHEKETRIFHHTLSLNYHFTTFFK